MICRLSALGAILCLCILPAGVAEEKKAEEEAAPPKPTAAQVEKALETLAQKAPGEIVAKFDALEVLARAEDPEQVEAILTAALKTQVGAFAVRAGEICNVLDPKKAIQLYEKRRKKLKQFGLVNAVRFLGEIKRPETVAKLAEHLKSREIWARCEALYGMVKQGGSKAEGYLLGALKSRDDDVRITAVIGCGLLKLKKASSLLIKGLDNSDRHYGYFCAWALGRMQDPGILAKALSATKGRMTGRTQQMKAKAINECAFDPAHVPVLIEALGQSNNAVVSAAADALGRIGKGSAEAADALTSLVLSARNRYVASLAADALGRIGTPAHGERLLQRYGANPGAIPQYVVKAIGLLKTAKAAPLLQQAALSAKDVALRKQACIAFWQCADRGARAKLQEWLKGAKSRRFENGCTLLGFDRSSNGFKYAVELLRAHFGKKSAKTVRGALENMTGHRFAPAPRIWNQWFDKNLDFFDRKPQFLNRDEWRKKLLKGDGRQKMGVSAKTEKAVELGLEWLARHQSPDGRWSCDKFTANCKLCYRKKCTIGARLGGWDLGMTGISVLAFFGAGYRPEGGRYKDVVLRGSIYCAVRQWADGDFGGQDDLIGGYTRPIAAIAIAETYGTTRDPEYLERTRRSVAHLVRIQYADAGWRYRLSGQFPGDTSVTGWNAWAIATGRKFGIYVDPMGLEGSNSLIDRFSSVVTQDEDFYNTDPNYFFEVGRGQTYEHFTGYNARDGTRPPMTAIGLICKIFMDRRRSHPYCIGAANTLLKAVPEYDERANKIKPVTGAEYPIYYWYYGSLAMYQMGGRFWRRWSRPFLTEGIPNVQIQGDQCTRGSWRVDNLDSIGGRVYTTAMAVLTLETFYRYLPVLQGN